MAWCYIAYGLAAFCAFVCAVMAYRRKTHLATVTGTMFLAACAANLTYLVRIGADTYFAASLTTSAYFVCLGFLVLSIVYYMVEFTRFKMERPRFKRVLIFTVYFLTFIDAAVLILNVFHEVILRYQHHADSIYAIKFMFEAKTGFYLHLAFVYLLVAMFFFILIRKTFSVPRIYRARYINTVLVLCVIGLLAIFYMVGILKTPVDLAVLVYGFVCPFVYRNTFDYASKGMLNTTRKMVLEYMGMPMILFDYEGFVADTNRDMRALFPESA